MSETLFKKLKLKDISVSDDDQRIFSAIITTNDIDRQGEVLLPSGLDSKEFAKTGTIFYNHDHGNAIGKTIQLKAISNGWQAKMQIMHRPDYITGDFFPDLAWAYIYQKVVKTMSIGFVVKKDGIRRASRKDIKDFGPEVKRVITRYKLVEISLAPLAANPHALISSVGKGLVTKGLIKKYFPDYTFPGDDKIELKAQVKEAVTRELLKRQGKIYY